MARRPAPLAGGLLDKDAKRFIVISGLFKGLLGLAALLFLPLAGFTLIAIQTVIFQTEAIGKLLSIYEARGRVGRNIALHLAVLVGLLLQVITMTVPGVRNLLGLSALRGGTVLAVLLVASAAVSGQYALKWMLRRPALLQNALL